MHEMKIEHLPLRLWYIINQIPPTTNIPARMQTRTIDAICPALYNFPEKWSEMKFSIRGS